MDVTDTPQTRSDDTPWFFSYAGQIQGPLPLEEIERLASTTKESQSWKVCREGMKRWYDLSDVKRRHTPAEEDRSLAEFREKVLKAEQTLKQHQPKTLSPEEESVAEKKTPVAKTHAPQNSADPYFALRGRLRLGSIRDPFAPALLNFPLTLGLSSIRNFRVLHQEVLWHVLNAAGNQRLHYWWAILPGLHFILIYKIAKLVALAETENKYRRTSPVLATILALVPPLAMIYLQLALNDHWRRHYCHYIQGCRHK